VPEGGGSCLEVVQDCWPPTPLRHLANYTGDQTYVFALGKVLRRRIEPYRCVYMCVRVGLYDCVQLYHTHR